MRKNIEKTDADEYVPKHSRYYKLSKEQENLLKKYIEMPAKWEYWYTCADWASDAINFVTKEKIDVNDWLWIGTPRELSQSIIEIEKTNHSTFQNPIQTRKEKRISN